MSVAKITEKPYAEEIKDEASFLITQPEIDEDGVEEETLKRSSLKQIAETLSRLGNFIVLNDSNVVTITKELGSFVCTDIDEQTHKYTFEVDDTSVFVSYTEYKVRVDDTDYLIRSTTINEDNVVFVAVEDAVPFEVGNTYNIRFETKNATSFGVDNKVYANEGFATGMANFIDEKGDQGVVHGYGNKLSGKAHLVAGSINNVYNGQNDNVFGIGNDVTGNYKFVAGMGLSVHKTSTGSVVLGNYNEDIKDAIFIIGAGSITNRKNALVVDKNGDIIACGVLTTDNNMFVKRNLDIGESAVIKGNLDVNGNVTIKGVIHNDVKVYGDIKANNIFPKDIVLVPNGDITNQNGELVARYNEATGIVDFDISTDSNGNPMGAYIRNCQTLVVPIEPVTLYGCYKKGGSYAITSNASFTKRLTDNGYYIDFAELSPNPFDVVRTKDNIVFNEPTTITKVELHTDTILNRGDKYYTWDFRGKGLSLSISQISDITAEANGAVVEYRDILDKSTSLRLKSPNGTVFKLTVADDGTLITTKFKEE